MNIMALRSIDSTRGMSRHTSRFLGLFCVLSVLTSGISTRGQPSGSVAVCPQHEYEVTMISRNPVVVYISSFITAKEAAHLVNLRYALHSSSKFEAAILLMPIFSQIHGIPARTTDGEVEVLDHTIKHSFSTYPLDDPTVACIKLRAEAFRGYDPSLHIEEPLLQRYPTGGHYVHHYDWYTDETAREVHGGNRDSTLLIYLNSNCTGGGTNFNHLEPPRHELWCDFIDCDEPWDAGTTFRPIAGNAVFWYNLHADGSGNMKTRHAGMPITSGMKYVLNIWSFRSFQGSGKKSKRDIR
jgi:prolyl 4-hydroxylase